MKTDLRDRVECFAKNTVGYKEASDKVSFMTGVSVAISLIEENEIEQLKRVSEGHKAAYENTVKDLKTLSSIINKYSDD